MWRNYPKPARSCGIPLGLLALASIILAVASTSVALASSSFYWYGENNSTCWQTGVPGASAAACDSVGAKYLSGSHQVEGGITAQIAISTSGDYCGYYRLGDALTSEDATNQSANTGYTTPTPYSSYQEADPHQNVCQASGSHWGQEVRDAAPGNGCATTCGMNHYVSLGSQGTNDRPWSSLFGAPTLVVSAEATPQVFNRTGSGTDVGGWGYVCPVLKDTTTGNVLEYCLQEWRSKYNTTEWTTERIGTCAGNGSIAIDTVQSLFSPGTQYVTEYSGSANTFAFTSEGWRHFEGGITQADLVNAVKADNAQCGRSDSTNPATYALIGVEQGLEGWRELALVGGSTANLQLHTEYTPLPPVATTSAASGVQQTQATLNGTVNPNATDTRYYFQYGETTAYGSSTSEGDAGSGTAAVPESATVTGLEPNTTYHYRLVAKSTAGESYGADSTFTTLTVPRPAAYVDGTTQEVFFRGTNNAIWQWQWEAANGKWYLSQLGGSAAGNPTAYVDGKTQDVFFRGTNGAIWQLQWEEATGKWVLSQLGGSAAGDPTAYFTSTTQEVYFRGTNGAIWQLQWEASNDKWYLSQLGGSAAGNPTAYFTSTTQEVYFSDANEAIWQLQWEAFNSKWYLSEL
jgi:hypothetical protein